MSACIKKLSFTLLIVALLMYTSCADEENDLWLLISSYEDMSISINDLATFLIAHGYNATPGRSYVTVSLSKGSIVYLTPNGASPRLADLWMTPPEKPIGPIRVSYDETIKKNATYVMSSNQQFLKDIRRSILFPLVPIDMCYYGSKQLGIIYTGLGYNVTYMFLPDGRGHMWVLVEDDGAGTWLAVDSYYGVMTSAEYYTSPYSFPRFELLDLVVPQWRVI
jgi:hypothetical protein